MNTFSVFCIPYYDKINQRYTSILSVNQMPSGPLALFVRRIQNNKLSPFQKNEYCEDKCKYVIYSENINSKCGCNFMKPFDLINFLLSNGYQIENQLTNVMNNSQIKVPREKLLYIVTYYGNNPPQIMYMR